MIPGPTITEASRGSAEASNASPAPVSIQDELERARQILFGAQKRNLDLGLDRLRQRITEEVSNLRAEQTARGTAQEADLKTAVSSLQEQITAARTASEVRFRVMAGDAASRERTLSGRIDQLEKQSDLARELALKLAARVEALETSFARAENRTRVLETELAKLGQSLGHRDREIHELLESRTARIHGEIEHVRGFMMESLQQLRALVINVLATRPIAAPVLERVASLFNKRRDPSGGGK